MTVPHAKGYGMGLCYKSLVAKPLLKEGGQSFYYSTVLGA